MDLILNHKNKRFTRCLFYAVVVAILGFMPSLHLSAKDVQQVNNTVTGVVLDTEGLPLIGVTVMIDGTSKGTITDIDGRYSVTINSENDVLSFAYIGLTPQKVKVGKQRTIDILMVEDSELIEEVVVVGYGYQKKESVVGSISSISSKDLVQAPVTNISNALAGRMTGLTAIQSTGEPGKNQSKLYVRGVGTFGGDASPLILIDGVERDNMDSLDPHEIETLNILKDASATAVFGVKGANGVILVTTKSGTTGRAKVSFTANAGIQEAINLPELLNSYDYAYLKNEALRNDGKNEIFSATDLQYFKEGKYPIFYPSKHWIKELLKSTAWQGRYNVNVSGGTPVMKYYLSAGYMFQDGLYGLDDLNVGFDSNPKYERYNIRTNFDFNISKNLTTSVRMGTSFSKSTYPKDDANSLFYSILGYPPFSSPGIVDGKLISGYVNDPLGGYNIQNRGESPYTKLLQNGYQESFGTVFNLNWSFDYKMDFIAKGLSARAMIAYDGNHNSKTEWNKTNDRYKISPLNQNLDDITFIQTNHDGNFGYSSSKSKWRKYYYEAALNYANTFESHSFTGLLLFNASKEHAPGLQMHVPRSVLGMAGRLTYNYKSRYLMEFNIGYNGSEQFPKGKRYGFFPAYSLGWILTEESFFPTNDILTYTKIRGSYGEVGNDKLGTSERFLYLPSVYTYESGPNSGYWFGTKGENLQKYPGAKEGKLGYPNVTWERSKKLNIGLEVKFFKDQLTVIGDYFSEKRDKILWQAESTPSLIAANLPHLNLGKMDNSGFEVESTWRSEIQKFNYWISGNVSFARNKVIYMDEPSMPYFWQNETGFSFKQYTGFRTDGFLNYPEDLGNRPNYGNLGGDNIQRGDLKYIDINGDGLINDYDKVPIGFTSLLPEINYGFSFGASYKGFDLSVLFQGVANSSRMMNEMAGWAFDWEWRSTLDVFKERWSVERFENGEKITQPRLAANGTKSVNSLQSDMLIKDAKYLRLKNLEIGYTLPSSPLRKVGISSFRIYTNGSNLLTFTPLKNIDPEATRNSGAYYPLTRVFNLGVNLQF